MTTGRHRRAAPPGASHRADRERARRVRAARLGSVSLGLLVVVATLSPFADSGDASAGVTATAVASSSVTKTVTGSRVHLDLATQTDVTVDTRTVQVTVDQTTQLRNRQAVTVSWTGAHPTGGKVSDRNSALAAQEEFPVVIMQCRGVDSTTVAAAQQLSPKTCWTSDPNERFKGNSTFLFPPFRMDRYAAPADRQQTVGVPSPLPAACAGGDAGAQHWVPFVGADGTVYGGGPIQGCAGMAPEAGGGTDTAPSNTTYGVTGVDGTGSSPFVINTVESNASLGCNDTTACSLVIVPIMGISCDVAAKSLPPIDRTPSVFKAQSESECTKQGHYLPGQDNDGGVETEDLAVSGELWWSASNWQNRVTVPLSFAPPSNVCDLVSNAKPTFMYGAQAMVQATLQWAPAFCLDPKLFKFQHVQFSEPGSRNLLDTGSIEAALVGGPPAQAFTKPVVQAPIALTGFAIAYRVDTSSGEEAKTLNLTPRLLAKLLTMSYPGSVGLRTEYTALSANPLDMVGDPEFRALNPGMMTYLDGYNITPAATLYSISADSDVVAAVTAYINADPDARAWLDGKADPWGMVVNPNYKKIALPTNAWPVLDNFVSKLAESTNPCLAFNPVPFLPLVAGPVSNPAAITLNMQYGIANSQIVCKDQGQPNQKLTGMGRQVPGRRALFGVVSLADAERYALPTASLLSHTDSGAADKFTDTAGRAFTPPTEAGLKAAAAVLAPVKASGTWPIPNAALRSAADAYPGTMLMSLDVPTQGLVATDAKRYAEFVRFAVTTGQQPGVGNGQLPAGYLPLTAGNGLGALVTYAQNAADAIAAQQGYVPAVDGSSRPPSPTPTPTPTPTPSPLPSTGGPSQSTGGGTTSTPAASASLSASPSPSSSSTPVAIVATGLTTGVSVGALGQVLPALLGLALLAGAAAIVTSLWGRS